MHRYYRILARFLAIILVLTAVSLPVNAATIPQILGFHITDKADSSRLVLDFSEKTPYEIFILSSPDRVVIDLPSGAWMASDEPPDVTFRIKDVRHAERSDGTLRIVMDLSQAVTIKQHLLVPPKGNHTYQLVVDLTPDKNLFNQFVTPQAITRDGTALGIPTPTLKERPKPVIIIDAGHGGHDPGTIGRQNTLEKDVTLAYAKALKAELLATERYRVVMTRERDVFVELKERVRRAERAQGDLFVSLHADSNPDRDAHGLSIYTLSEKASDKEAAELAQKENRSGVIGDLDVATDDDDISSLMIDLVQRETKNLSASFAETTIRELQDQIYVLRNTHRFAGFRVLTGAKVPSVLIELGYLSNRSEEKLLTDEDYKNKLAKAFVRAIDSHFGTYSIDR